ALHVQAELGQLVAYSEVLSGFVRAAVSEVAAARKNRTAVRTLASALWVFLPEAHVRAADVMRRIAGSGLIMTPTERDFRNPEIAPYIERYLQGRNVDARRRGGGFKVSWGMAGGGVGSRPTHNERFFAG